MNKITKLPAGAINPETGRIMVSHEPRDEHYINDWLVVSGDGIALKHGLGRPSSDHLSDDDGNIIAEYDLNKLYYFHKIEDHGFDSGFCAFVRAHDGNLYRVDLAPENKTQTFNKTVDFDRRASALENLKGPRTIIINELNQQIRYVNLDNKNDSVDNMNTRADDQFAPIDGKNNRAISFKGDGEALIKTFEVKTFAKGLYHVEIHAEHVNLSRTLSLCGINTESDKLAAFNSCLKAIKAKESIMSLKSRDVKCTHGPLTPFTHIDPSVEEK